MDDFNINHLTCNCMKCEEVISYPEANRHYIIWPNNKKYEIHFQCSKCVNDSIDMYEQTLKTNLETYRQ